MITERHTREQILDLALIGNSCAAALVDRNARTVWWCFPYFDSDPAFSRLLAGDEEQGFSDVTLAGLAETQSGHLAIRRLSRRSCRREPLAGLPRITAFGLLSEDISSGHQRGSG